MSTETTTNNTGPLACKSCGDTDGPFVPGTGLCENCDPEARLLSALEDGGHLDGNARALLDAYAALVLQRAGGGQ